MADFTHVDARIAQARQAVDALFADIRDWCEDRPHRVVPSVEDDALVLRAQVLKEPPLDWSLRASDISASLRFALDYMVYAIAVAATGSDPPPKSRSLAFPVAKAQERWPEFVQTRLANLPADAVQVIESHQPFIEGNGGETSWLVYLDELCNVSKHRLLPLVLARLHSTTLGLKFQGRPPHAIQAEKIDQLTDGVVLARIIPQLGHEPASLEVEVELDTRVAFAPHHPGYLQPVEECLPNLVAAVTGIRDQLASLFGVAPLTEA